MMKKRGQFYLVAAIIIIVIIFGFFTIRNYAKTEKKETIVYDLKKEFGLEGGKVIDFAIYNETDYNKVMENWTKTYVPLKGKDASDFVVVYGNSTTLTLLNYNQTSSGTVSIGGSGVTVIVTSPMKTDIAIAGNDLNIIFEDFQYNFTLQPGKNFIFLIREGQYIEKEGKFKAEDTE